MSDIGKPESETQERVIKLFREELGYRYPTERFSFQDSSQATSILRG